MESPFFTVFSFPWFSNVCYTFYKKIRAYLYSIQYFLQRCTCLFVQLSIVSQIFTCLLVQCSILLTKIYMFIRHPKGALPVAPGGHLSHQPGKCMISYAHLQMQIQMQINGSGWFPMVSNASVWFQ